MRKPRIIIADTDVNYIIPLQLKFVEDYFEKIDLEIITDKEVFDDIFSSPQQADILIICEDLYSQAIQRHNIGHVFLMSEDYEENQNVDPNVHCIFKYSNIIEIFNEIKGRSADALSVTVEEQKETQVLLVYSASGGVGKTTVAMGISACLAKNYKRVLYINAGHLQTFHRLLEDRTPVSVSNVYGKLSRPSENVYQEIKHIIREEQFHYLPPFKAGLMSLGVEYSIYRKIAESAKDSKDYDYIVIDADTTFDEEKARLIGFADKVVVVTDQTIASVYATNILVANITGANSGKYIFICNKFDEKKEDALQSNTMRVNFKVQDYIDYIEEYNQMSGANLHKNIGIQRTAFLVM